MDLRDLTVWQTNDEGDTFTVVVPFAHCRFPWFDKMLVGVSCEGRDFTPDDREYAQTMIDVLPHRLERCFAEIKNLLGFTDEETFHADMPNPLLILEAGYHRGWTFGLSNRVHEETVFIEWDGDEVKRVGNSHPVFGD